MIPSVTGAQVRRGIEEFLRTTFPITNPYFAGALDETAGAPRRGLPRSLYLAEAPVHLFPRRSTVLPRRRAGVVSAIPPPGASVGAPGLEVR